MRIKSLNIKGFKTFYEKSVVNFDSEISTIVGPNGCGKTNLLDAMRWVLGEQNPRLLRLDSMSQVVADGNDNLPKQNFAEVSLLIENFEEEAFVETEIKRKLYRNGESEYYLNGNQCRLKDITEVVMSAGAGSRSFTIIPQGQIDTYIIAKPEDKRQLIDEAAGLSIYKLKRAETERKILLVQDNLERTKDIHAEIKNQKDLLEEQSNKAKKYTALVDQFRDLEVLFYKNRYQELDLKLIKSCKEKEEFELLIKNLEDRKKEIKLLTESNSKKHGELGIEQESSTNLLLNEKEKKLKIHSKIQIIESENNMLVLELERAKNNKVELKNEVSSYHNDVEKIQKSNDLSAIKVRELESQMNVGSEPTEESEMSHAQVKKRLLDAVENYSSLKTSHSILENELKELSLKHQMFNSESKRFEESAISIKEKMEEIKKNCFELESIKEACVANKSEEDVKLSNLNGELKIINDKFIKINSDIEATKSRVKVLENIESTYGWLPEGIRNFVHELKGKSINGTVSDYLNSKEGYEKAVEAALGEKLKWIMINNNKDAIETIKMFKNTGVGRGTFISLENRRMIGASSDIGETNLLDCIECDTEYRPFLSSILGDTFVTEDLLSALKAKEKNPEYNFVTKDGEFFDSNGSISVGSAPENILQIKDEIKDLIKQKIEYEKDIDLVNIEIKKIEDEVFDINMRINTFDNEIISYSDSYSTMSKELSDFSSKLNNEISSKEKAETQIKETEANLKFKKNKLSETFYEIEVMLQEKNKFEERFNFFEGNKDVQVSEFLKKSKLKEVENLKSAIQNQSTFKSDLAEKIDKLESKIDIESSRIIKLEEKIEANSDSLTELKSSTEVSDKEEKELMERIALIKDKINSNKNELNLISNDSILIDEELEKKRQQSLIFGSNLQKIELEINQLFEILQADSKDYDIKNISEEEKLAISNLQKDNLLSKSHFYKLQKSIDSFGPVNLLAPEEFEKLEERYDFIAGEISDLETSLTNLNKTIDKIDNESESAFLETFSKISHKYDEYIKTLFGGGEGKLVLTNPNSIKDTGIEVMLKIGLKKYRTLKSYSGGERALAGIALLLSAYFVKPAPFLLLDEVDAPLDDKNISKFGEMLKEISKKSQVAIITHNKKTMKFTNRLIGITSKLEGLSEVVPIDLQN